MDQYLTPGKSQKRLIEEYLRHGSLVIGFDFDGTVNEKGYKVLDSHVGCIYGDSITPEVAEEMCIRSMDKGFASQCVLGIGSYTYQMKTRDTFGMAMKATYIEYEENFLAGDESVEWAARTIGMNIFKDPITDDGTKKSAKGLIMVGEKANGEIYLKDECSWEDEAKGLLEPVFRDGKILKRYTLSEIRKNVQRSI